MTILGIGLDFGTSNSGVAAYDGERIRVLPVDEKNVPPEVVKSILYITKDHRTYIGQEAVELYYRQNINRARRFVRKWAGELEYVGSEMSYVRDVFVYVDDLKPGRLLQYLKTALRRTSRSNDYDGTQIFDRYYQTVDLVEAYLRELKKRAEETLGKDIDHVTLGRPVKFSDDIEQDRKAEEALQQAAIRAGFGQVDFELEPIAAALYYEKSLLEPQNALVFDFGGGTLDLAIVRLGDPSSRIRFASGGIDIAGSDFDRAIIEKRLLPFFGSEEVSHQPEIQELIQSVPDWLALPELSTPQNRYNLERAIQEKISPVALKRLLSLIFNDLAFPFYYQVESAKITLSSQGAASISLNDTDLDLWELYTRRQFESDIKTGKEQIEKTLWDTIQSSGLEPQQIDAVVKTGGSSNIPLFSEMLAQIFGKQKLVQTNSFSSVVSGLAIRAFERISGSTR